MWNILRFFGMLLLLAHFGWAQNPADVSFALNTKNGQTSFRQGEAIPVELRFQSTTPGRYQVTTDPSQRIHLNGARVYDQLIGEPAADAVDPLREQTRMVEPFMGAPPRQMPLNASPISIEQIVNDWISFRKPGRYEITAQTWRLSLVDNSEDSARVFFPKPLPMQSNTIEIEIVPAEDAWANTQLQQAVASLNHGVSPPIVGQPIDTQRQNDVVTAARVLRFLETRDAALALVRFFDRSPYNVQGDLVAGLYGSPYRNEIVSALEDGLTSPDVPVTHNWIDTLSELATARDFGPAPPYDKDQSGSMTWNKHFMDIRDRYMKILTDAVTSKQAQARAVSLDVLSYRNSPKPASPASIEAVVENFKDLPEDTQNRYLTMDWSRIASSEIEPLVLSLAKGTGQARDAALMRLQELNPAAARPIILDRIRKGDIPQGPYSDPRTLLMLPDRVLPEMDRSLVEMLEQDKNVGALISRYVSNAMFGRIQAWVEAHSYSICGPVLPYLFRVAPTYAADRLAKTREFQTSCYLSMSQSEDPFISPGLERAAIADLESPNVMTQRAAQTLLQNGGSATAEEPLLNGMEHLRERNPQDQQSLETGYVQALTKGVGWVLSPEKLNRLSTACISDSCRLSVESMRRYTEPIGIECSGLPNDITSIRIGQYLVHGLKQMDAKIRQFPRGTRFFFPTFYHGVWYYEQQMSKILRLLDAAGMLVVDQPARN
jgi:hypothetical protein